MTNLTTRPEAVTGSGEAPAPLSFGRRLLWLGPTGVIVAVGLSVIEWVVVRGPGSRPPWLAALLALTMTAPVVLARRWPLLAASVVAVAAVANWLLFPDLVRCSGAVPAALYIAFAVGARTRETGRGWGGTVIGLVITSAACWPSGGATPRSTSTRPSCPSASAWPWPAGPPASAGRRSRPGSAQSPVGRDRRVIGHGVVGAGAGADRHPRQTMHHRRQQGEERAWPSR